MPATHEKDASSTRNSTAEVLAARVRVADEAAVAAFHAADDDRRRVQELEWGKSNHDTLADIEEIADTLHGFASWVLSGSSHPQPEHVKATLIRLAFSSQLALRTAVWSHLAIGSPLWKYVDHLEQLRKALIEYFEETSDSSAAPTSG